MSAYVLVSWLLFLTTVATLFFSILKHRYLLVKPSIATIFFFTVTIQFAATVSAARIESYLPEPLHFLLLAHGFPLIGLFGSLLFQRDTASFLFKRIDNYEFKQDKSVIKMLWFITALISVAYLAEVPLRSTGLYSIITDPISSVQAREDSLKLLDNAFVRYGYLFLMSVVAPLLAIMIYYQASYQKKFRNTISAVIQIIFIFILVSFSGARSAAVNILLAIIIAHFLKNKFKFNLYKVLISIFAIMLIPAILSIMREGAEMSSVLIIQYIVDSIFGRIFYVPMEVGLWHVHYAQTNGLIYAAGIPKLANLLGIEAISLANVIYLTYTPYVLESGSANTSFVFSYYAMFGIAILPILLLLLWSLDLCLPLLKKMKPQVLLPTIACLILISKAFTVSDFTTTLITHGYILLFILAIFLDWFGKSKFIIIQHKSCEDGKVV